MSTKFFEIHRNNLRNADEILRKFIGKAVKMNGFILQEILGNSYEILRHSQEMLRNPEENLGNS